MKFAGHQSRSRNAAPRTNVLDRKILLTEISFLYGNEMIHVRSARGHQRGGDVFGARVNIEKRQDNKQPDREIFPHRVLPIANRPGLLQPDGRSEFMLVTSS